MHRDRQRNYDKFNQPWCTFCQICYRFCSFFLIFVVSLLRDEFLVSYWYNYWRTWNYFVYLNRSLFPGVPTRMTRDNGGGGSTRRIRCPPSYQQPHHRMGGAAQTAIPRNPLVLHLYSVITLPVHFSTLTCNVLIGIDSAKCRVTMTYYGRIVRIGLFFLCMFAPQKCKRLLVNISFNANSNSNEIYVEKYKLISTSVDS